MKHTYTVGDDLTIEIEGDDLLGNRIRAIKGETAGEWHYLKQERDGLTWHFETVARRGDIDYGLLHTKKADGSTTKRKFAWNRATLTMTMFDDDNPEWLGAS